LVLEDGEVGATFVAQLPVASNPSDRMS
jgi:hypothetical protein